MSLTTYSACACANCGYVIEYRSSRAGETVTCPKCNEQSVLPAAKSLEMIEILGPAIPKFRDCPVCGTQNDFANTSCYTCAQARKRKFRMLLLKVAVCLIAIVCIGELMSLLLKARTRARIVAGEIPAPKAPNIVIAQPYPRGPKSTNDLKPGKFVLEKWRGRETMVASGDIQNISEHSHERLRADMDVLDKNGTKVGSVSDYCTELAPHQTWHCVATVAESNAMSLRLVNIHEDE